MTESVIVTHGLWMPGWETGVFRRRLAAAGFAPRLFRFHSVRDDLDGTVERLSRFAARVPGDVLHFVGFSLGGVVVLELLGSGRVARARRAVCVGSPLTGSLSAAKLARLPGGRRALGRTVRDLVERGGLPAWSGACEVASIAGEVSVGLGWVLHAVPGPSDGTVAVDETRLPGIDAHIVLPVSHTAMLFSKSVADHVVRFLRTGSLH